MVSKKFILNADKFGMSKAFNRAVLNGYHNGFLTSASVCANGKAFNAAVNEIIPECPNLGIGVHLNIITGRALTKVPLLTNKRGKFNNNFFKILLKSNNSKYLEQIEFEFRTQIETVMNYTKIDHIDSVGFIHSIPSIFNIVVKLAKEYNIPYVRTHYEEIYLVSSLRKYFKYPANLLKALILNKFSSTNKKMLDGIKTNSHILGIEYSMDTETILSGLEAIEEDCLVEVVICPCHYSISNKNQNYIEFLVTQDKTLKDKITRLGFDITNYKKEHV